MSEPGGGSRPGRGMAVLTALLPGAWQLLGGRRFAGGVALALWLGSLGVLAARWDRLGAALGGSLDERLAGVVLFLALAGSWTWSFADARGARGAGVPRGGWALVFRAFRRNRAALAGMTAVLGLFMIALLAPILAPQDPVFQGHMAEARLLAPSGGHWLGTDQFARDVFSRLLYGARISLSIGLLAVSIAVVVGTLLGAISGFLGGRADAALMRFVDMVLAFPRLVLLIAIVAVFQPSISLIILVLGLTQWPGVARLVRGEVLSLREREFVEAGRALGFSRVRIVGRHILPNALAPVIVAAALGMGDAIILEAGLSFLGLGVQAPTASWGTMVADGRDFLVDGWWIATFPGLAIALTVLCLNLAGDGLRDALDPRLRS